MEAQARSEVSRAEFLSFCGIEEDDSVVVEEQKEDEDEEHHQIAQQSYKEETTRHILSARARPFDESGQSKLIQHPGKNWYLNNVTIVYYVI